MRIYRYIELWWMLVAFILLLGLANITKADYIYDLQATLTEGEAVYVDQEPFYYDIFHIHTEGQATLTFNNYDANLGSSNPRYDYNDPYLYLYTIQQPSFTGFSSANVQLVLFDEDDDGNENSPEGLYFFLDNVIVNNQLVAVISSYDPYVVGTVDFTITSNKPLSIIPEPATAGLIAIGAFGLLLIRRFGLCRNKMDS
tara:strand:- start:331 stop:927 length:597 start_codon:yes stop_codon:yes gene_type:complete